VSLIYSLSEQVTLTIQAKKKTKEPKENQLDDSDLDWDVKWMNLDDNGFLCFKALNHGHFVFTSDYDPSVVVEGVLTAKPPVTHTITEGIGALVDSIYDL
jgi:hypothetical protein